MKTIGIDIGSRAIKAALADSGKIIWHTVKDTTHNPIAVCADILNSIAHDNIVATGYGRHLFESNFKNAITISEIKAAAIGARYYEPQCQAVLDIGGQDTKAILLTNDGKIKKFVMNDRCAAGTGRFLEVMSVALSYTPEQFSMAAAQASHAVSINSMCAVFAESEIISMVAKGTDRKEIALGIHQSIATRALALLKSITKTEKTLFSGGVAKNNLIPLLLNKNSKIPILVPQNPQIVTATGCAIFGLATGANSSAALP
jgi:predicted CoA-substrate-specific enzyme activase